MRGITRRNVLLASRWRHCQAPIAPPQGTGGWQSPGMSCPAPGFGGGGSPLQSAPHPLPPDLRGQAARSGGGGQLGAIVSDSGRSRRHAGDWGPAGLLCPPRSGSPCSSARVLTWYTPLVWACGPMCHCTVPANSAGDAPPPSPTSRFVVSRALGSEAPPRPRLDGCTGGA
jgi:hypothetical protein